MISNHESRWQYLHFLISAKPQAYRPPGARGKESAFKLHDDEPTKPTINDAVKQDKKKEKKEKKPEVPAPVPEPLVGNVVLIVVYHDDNTIVICQ